MTDRYRPKIDDLEGSLDAIATTLRSLYKRQPDFAAQHKEIQDKLTRIDAKSNQLYRLLERDLSVVVRNTERSHETVRSIHKVQKANQTYFGKNSHTGRFYFSFALSWKTLVFALVAFITFSGVANFATVRFLVKHPLTCQYILGLGELKTSDKRSGCGYITSKIE
jgi:hypothetical protein